MSTFQVKIEPIFIKSHPNADALDLGNIHSPNGWQVVTKKGLYQSGDLVAYIGENAVVPEWVLKQYGFWNHEKNNGLLAGSKGNRVKMVKLRGESSLGICIPVKKDDKGFYIELQDGQISYVCEGIDVADLLEVTKYEPPIPAQLAGEVFNGSMSVGVNYDIEDIKNYPDVLIDGEEVQITVKVHGSNLQCIWINPSEMENRDLASAVNIDEWIKVEKDGTLIGYIAVGSKGLGAKGTFFKDNERNISNTYLKTARPYFQQFAEYCLSLNQPIVTIVGEIFGVGIQKGFDYGQKGVILQLFDVYFGYRGRGRYINDDELDEFCKNSQIPRVPLLYKGPYSYELLDQLANAPESAFTCGHIREGVIVKPVKERYVEDLGRVALKHRSIQYMLKSTGEEIN